MFLFSLMRMIRILYLVSLVVLCYLPHAAQDANADRPKRVEYINRNMIDSPTISLHSLQGRAIDSNGVAVPSIRIALFTEKDHKFVAQTVTDENGYFRFEKTGNGSYRLVGRLEYDYLCPVNVRVRQVSSPFVSRKTKLVLHMRPSGIDDCSFGTTK